MNGFFLDGDGSDLSPGDAGVDDYASGIVGVMVNSCVDPTDEAKEGIVNNDIIDTTTTKTSKRSVSSATARFATVGMAGLLLLGGAAVGAPAMAAGAAPVGDASAAVAGSQHGKRQVSLKAPRSATTGTKVTLKGKVKKNRHHKTRVLIQKKHGKKWTKLDSTKTNKKGTFRTSDVLTGKKKVTLRAKAKGHGTSATQTVKLTKATNGNNTPATPATPAQPAAPQQQPAAPQPQPPPVDPKLPDSGHVINVINGQQLQDELAKAGGQTVTIKLNGSSFTATQAQDSFGDFASVFTVGGNSNVTLTGQGTLNAKKMGNTVGVHSGSTLTIDGGITITNGAEKDGAGIYNEGTVNLKAGATVTANTATEDGGGIYNGYMDSSHKGKLMVEQGATIDNNNASHGGGIYNNAGTAELTGGSITNNTSRDSGGGINNHAGTVELAGGTISDNTAVQDGGGINNVGGTVELTGGSINDNTADGPGNSGEGGGIRNFDGTVTLKGGTISGNTASGDGGGIYNAAISDGKLNLTDYVTVTRNTAPLSGSGIWTTHGTLYMNGNPVTKPGAPDIVAVVHDNEGSSNIHFTHQ